MINGRDIEINQKRFKCDLEYNNRAKENVLLHHSPADGE
jgi:hypothetical protein